jgi:hypothetical protein
MRTRRTDARSCGCVRWRTAASRSVLYPGSTASSLRRRSMSWRHCDGLSPAAAGTGFHPLRTATGFHPLRRTATGFHPLRLRRAFTRSVLHPGSTASPLGRRSMSWRHCDGLLPAAAGMGARAPRAQRVMDATAGKEVACAKCSSLVPKFEYCPKCTLCVAACCECDD